MSKWRAVEIDLPTHVNINIVRCSFIGYSDNRRVQYIGEDDNVSRKVRKRLEEHVLTQESIVARDRLVGVLTEIGEGQDV